MKSSLPYAPDYTDYTYTVSSAPETRNAANAAIHDTARDGSLLYQRGGVGRSGRTHWRSGGATGRERGDERTQSANTAVADPQPRPLGGRRQRHAMILIVENEANNRCLMEQVLLYAGYQTRSARNGLEALNLLDREHIDLVLTDLSMPVLDGYRATELMRRRPGNATLPIIAVTAHAMSDDRELALRSGCTDYLVKPYRPRELVRMVERWLRANHA